MNEETNLPIESRIFVKDHLTDFEKLLQARGLIKILKKRLDNYNFDDKIKSLNLELGKANSYIQELEAKVKDLERQNVLNKAEYKEIKKEAKATELYKQQQNKISSFEKDIHRLRRDRDILIAKLVNNG